MESVEDLVLLLLVRCRDSVFAWGGVSSGSDRLSERVAYDVLYLGAFCVI